MKIIFLIFILILFQACNKNQHSIYKKTSPSELIKSNDGRTKVVLSLKGYERLGIEISDVTYRGKSIDIPSSALIYDNHGELWVYVLESERTFHRIKVKLLDISHKKASVNFVNDGQYSVVITGVAELFGTESGVGK